MAGSMAPLPAMHVSCWATLTLVACVWHAQYGENLALWEPPSYWTASDAIQAWYAEGAQVGSKKCRKAAGQGQKL